MAPLRLTLSCGLYEITRAILNGDVTPSGIDLTVLREDPRRIYTQSRREEAQVAEFNITEYFRSKEAGQPITAVPIFPHRRFREGYYFVRPDGDVHRPADLIGRRGGISGVGRPAAGVWMRGILQDRYGVALDSVDWFENDAEPVDGSAPGELTKTVTDESLVNGDIDLLISPLIPDSFERGDPRIVRLFDDDVAESIAYYEATRIFPIMHVITVDDRIVEANPWVIESLLEAFTESKRIGFQKAANPRLAPLAFYEAAWERQRALLGPDPWEYGLSDANVHNLETIIRYCHEQGRIGRTLPVSEIFAGIR